MNEALAQEVRQRARHICEYCRMPATYSDLPFPIDHIIALQHGGPTISSNLALACLHCNGHKGPNIAGIDRPTRKLMRLFNPRRHRWHRHFRWEGPVLIGMTPIGRVTVVVLAMNEPALVAVREGLLDNGYTFD